MLLQFSIKNYKVFKEEQIFSMLAAGYKEHMATHTTTAKKHRVLKTAALYGPNASGKSIFFKALNFFKGFVVNSSKESVAQDAIPTDPFRLHTNTAQAPSEFEIIFVHNNLEYRYGFIVDTQKVQEEWLFVKNKREVPYFHRTNGVYEYNTSKLEDVKFLEKRNMIRDNALLLSVLAQFNDPTALTILEWFNEFHILSGLNASRFKAYTIQEIERSASFKQDVLALLKAADVGIDDFGIEDYEVNFPAALAELKDSPLEHLLKDQVGKRITTYRYKHDAYNRPLQDKVAFDFNTDESAGTQKYFSLLGPILDTLREGGILFIDELDARLHVKLVEAIVQLFHRSDTNPNQAQLIFATHNTHLMNKELLRRDQIWLVNKGLLGDSQLYALSDYADPEEKSITRPAHNYEKRYLEGRYHAIPSLHLFELKTPLSILNP